MRKLSTLIFFAASFIALTGCSEATNLPVEKNAVSNTKDSNTQLDAGENKENSNFKPEITIDFKSTESKLTSQEQQAFEVLKNNLNALVKHDRNLYESGFKDKQLVESMSDYLDNKWLYKFTQIESIEKNKDIENQFHITVIGERLNTSTDVIENVKLMYAIRSDDQSDWKIYTID